MTIAKTCTVAFDDVE